MLLTVGTLLVKVGAWGGGDEARLKVMELEIQRLRDWRHSVGNLQQKDSVLEMVIERLKRLEAKVFNGSAK